MRDIDFTQMMTMQKELFELHKNKWSPMEAKYGRNFVLWMIEEIGEVISIIKKKGDEAIMTDTDVRKAFTEEMADVMMYFVDTLLRYGVTPEEFATAYSDKHEYDLKRNYDKEREKKPAHI